MKNKINNYDFLVVGSGLIGSLAAINLLQSDYRVLVVDKSNYLPKDNRTLAVNANSKDFLVKLGLWNKLKSQPEPIKKIKIKDSINNEPLLFENIDEEMGNVIINKELLIESRKSLSKKKLLIEGVDIDISKIKPNQKIKIKDEYYTFRKIILSLGKNFQAEHIVKKFSFPGSHKSFVGFFEHSLVHHQVAYEIFTKDGPIAVLPAPNKSKKRSTFIYSSKKNSSHLQIQNLIRRNFSSSHGLIKFKSNIFEYNILPHISKEKFNNFILLGDTLRSIHPVAGQGWNLGIKDIQSLILLLKENGISDPNLLKKYYGKRTLENFSYLSFTSLINNLYENQNLFTNSVIKIGFEVLKRSELLRKTFIKQAMGRLKLI